MNTIQMTIICETHKKQSLTYFSTKYNSNGDGDGDGSESDDDDDA